MQHHAELRDAQGAFIDAEPVIHTRVREQIARWKTRFEKGLPMKAPVMI